jgi:hypothetical protein
MGGLRQYNGLRSLSSFVVIALGDWKAVPSIALQLENSGTNNTVTQGGQLQQPDATGWMQNTLKSHFESSNIVLTTRPCSRPRFLCFLLLNLDISLMKRSQRRRYRLERLRVSVSIV